MKSAILCNAANVQQKSNNLVTTVLHYDHVEVAIQFITFIIKGVKKDHICLY